MTKKFTYRQKNTGDILSAEEWNALAQDVDAAVDSINSGIGGNSTTPAAIDAEGIISVNNKGNVTISSTKHINLEPAYVQDGGSGTYGDIQIKPGDDITLESHHRATDKRNEITIKTSNGKDKNDPDKASVKLQLKAADITLSTEGKKVPEGSNDSNNVMNVNVTTGEGKGYLKVRAQAIDLRCEDHGGIALQPKGDDGHGHENKIKFEHDGGDGKEFGTFNTEHTSIFTNDYRFNEAGTVYAVTRGEVSPQSYKEDGVTPKKIDYPTQSDDFKDIINESKAAKWIDIVKTAYAMNGAPGIETKITSKGNLQISTSDSLYEILQLSQQQAEEVVSPDISLEEEPTNVTLPDTNPRIVDSTYVESFVGNDNISTVESADGAVYVKVITGTASPGMSLDTFGEVDENDNEQQVPGVSQIGGEMYNVYKLSRYTPNINLESDNNIKIKASDDIELDADGYVDFKTSVVKAKDTNDNVESISMADIIKLVNWFKNTDNLTDMGTVNPFNVEPQL